MTMINMSNADYPVISYSVTINGIVTRVWLSTNISPGIVTSSINPAYQFSSDLSYWLDSVSYLKLKTNQHYELDINLTWSVSGSTEVYYSLTSNNGNTVPDWVSLNLLTSKLILNTPKLTKETNYTFDASLTLTGDANVFQKHILLQVLYWWEVEHWESCQLSQYDKWQKCESGYIVYSDFKLCSISQVSNEVDGMSTATIAALITGATSVIIVAILSITSPQGLWIMINQIQLLLLLFITGAFIPKDVADYIVGMKFASFSFGFINYDNLWLVSKYYDYFDWNQPNDYIDRIEVNSWSIMINIFPLITTIFYTLILHILIVLFKRILKGLLNRYNKLKKIFEILIVSFTLSAYIRLFIESQQFILISAASEIREFEHLRTNRKISIVFAFIVYFICFMITITWLFITIRSLSEINFRRTKYFIELFKGLRNWKLVRPYSFISQSRKFIFISFLLFFSDVNFFIKHSIVFFLQVLYYAWILISRPYEKIKNLICEMINEFFFNYYLAYLFYFNQPESWSNFSSKFYISVIMANNIIVVIIYIGKFAFNHRSISLLCY